MKTRLSAFSAATFFLALFPLLALAQQTQPPTGPQPYGYGYGPGPWHMWSGGWGFGWMFPLFILFVIVCVAVLFFGRRSCGGHAHWGPGRSWSDPTYSALQILNERYAKGEIQKQEYEEKKSAILSGGPR